MGKIFWRITTAVILIFCGLIIWRCCIAADKSKFSDLTVTDSLTQAYSDGESVIYTVKVAAELADDGYFTTYGFFYNPESSEVQLAVRWNDSVYEYTDMEEGHEYSFYLLNETTGEKYPATAVDSARATMYNYRKLIAPGVKLENEEKLVIVMELRDGYESSMVIKHAEQPFEAYKLPKKLAEELTK